MTPSTGTMVRYADPRIAACARSSATSRSCAAVSWRRSPTARSTVPEIAAAVERPSHEVMFWVMGLRKYGWLAEIKEATDEGYFRYQVVEREGS